MKALIPEADIILLYLTLAQHSDKGQTQGEDAVFILQMSA